jgi:hypothetical protein
MHVVLEVYVTFTKSLRIDIKINKATIKTLKRKEPN